MPVAIETSRGLLVAYLRATGRRVDAINPLAVSRYRDRHGVAGTKSDQLQAALKAADDLAGSPSTSIGRHPDHQLITSFPGLGELTGTRVLPRDRRRPQPVRGRARLEGLRRRRTHYDRRRHAGDHHAAAQRNLFNRLLGMLHHCLATNQPYSKHRAFPAPRAHAA